MWTDKTNKIALLTNNTLLIISLHPFIIYDIESLISRHDPFHQLLFPIIWVIYVIGAISQLYLASVLQIKPAFIKFVPAFILMMFLTNDYFSTSLNIQVSIVLYLLIEIIGIVLLLNSFITTYKSKPKLKA